MPWSSTKNNRKVKIINAFMNKSSRQSGTQSMIFTVQIGRSQLLQMTHQQVKDFYPGQLIDFYQKRQKYHKKTNYTQTATLHSYHNHKFSLNNLKNNQVQYSTMTITFYDMALNHYNTQIQLQALYIKITEYMNKNYFPKLQNVFMKILLEIVNRAKSNKQSVKNKKQYKKQIQKQEQPSLNQLNQLHQLNSQSQQL